MSQFVFPDQTGFYQGKVRDVYTIDNNMLVMIASDRLSAFDVILPRLIPYKGQVLNSLAAFMLRATKDICPNWLLSTPTPHSSIGYKCQPFKIEVVVRGNLCGHAWRTYQSGSRMLCGVQLPDRLRESDYFPKPIITPSTKAEEGHDEDITEADLLSLGLATETEWEQIKTYALQLFERGKEIAQKRGLILADTKYEFGKRNGDVMLMDEIHTPDSSRYFHADGFEERQSKGMSQKQLSKEFVREWLIENEFMGKEGQTIPLMSDEWVQTISDRYVDLYQKLTGQAFIPMKGDDEDWYREIVDTLNRLNGH